MSRILALDYGGKRTGVAVTDELQIIASPLDTIETSKLMDFLKQYIEKENVSDLVVGLSVRFSGELNEIENQIQPFLKKFSEQFPLIKIHRENEMFTSKMASRAMFEGGMKKKKRQEKGMVDKVSAVIILQSFLAHKL
ncbi:Holliday junction resolvase RuvX [Empedobacter brevis]|uniref:Putative pre-16S rRNA nuclease n=2 Tax=Empedobacter brevis TaxID=247 RepID=A0A511NG11_9FLAO|nr:Holliday junction resolvase RuvX [Empedobacter brevis]MDM1073924.1 Holliday junction resolvase RuvX [Empedobacter brevis]QES92983.1 Holliday junction resolvase RuvX [Empedobacter brevis]QHC84806.1 Holliday junction resolvase [Empedobacter brevis]GEM51752.1 putative pre-16S rRNA nuclease [Empedobacter brevis NBRC 14943 = ATCC 43319]